MIKCANPWKSFEEVEYDMMRVVLSYLPHADKLPRVYYHFVVMFCLFCGNYVADVFLLENNSTLVRNATVA